MGSETCLILHRKSANVPAVKEAVRAVREKGIDVRVRIPWNKKDKPRVVREALDAGATRIVAGGGDGTINAVANALVRKRKGARATLGVLPLGTANDFAHGVGLPVEDLAQCLEIACTREAKPIDVGCANGRSFLNVTSGGFGAEITATTPVEMKKKLGGVAYTLMGIVKAFDLKPYEGRLLVPGEDPVDGAMLFMAVGNSRLAGGGFEVAPKARLDDGLLDLAMLQHREGTSLSDLASALLAGDVDESEHLYYRQLSSFTLESNRPIHYNLDGEPMEETRVEFSVRKRYLGVAC